MLSMRGGEPDVVKVLDFGLVKRIDHDHIQDAHDDGRGLRHARGSFRPRPCGIPPVFDARGDIYALGAVAYELITGPRIFERTTVYETCRKHMEWIPSCPPSASGARCRPLSRPWSWRAWRRTPSARPQTVVELGELLDSCEDVGPWTKADAREWWGTHAAQIAALRPPDPPAITRLEAPGQHSATRRADRRQRLDDPRVIPAESRGPHDRGWSLISTRAWHDPVAQIQSKRTSHVEEHHLHRSLDPNQRGVGGSTNPVIHWPLELVVTEKIGMAVARSTFTVHPDPST